MFGTPCYSNQSICKPRLFGLLINLTDLTVIKSLCRPVFVNWCLRSCREWVWQQAWQSAQYNLNNIVTNALGAPSGISSVLCAPGSQGEGKRLRGAIWFAVTGHRSPRQMINRISSPAPQKDPVSAVIHLNCKLLIVSRCVSALWWALMGLPLEGFFFASKCPTCCWQVVPELRGALRCPLGVAENLLQNYAHQLVFP